MVILKAENISKTYKAGSVEVPALKKCDVSFELGEFAAIIGKSGSGKSTLLRILGSMDKPDGGSVVIDGLDILKLKDKELSKFRREKIGFIYQDYSLFQEFTTYENIVMPLVLDKKAPDKEEVDELLEQLEISHCKNKYPTQMSGGEQQRVAIARALITHPAVIFADEPTGNLDAESAGKVADMLSMASDKYNQTIIMVTHDKQMADYADRILTIADGNIKYNG
ncbi:MAG: ABC transporter ATP-binding protein [Lachnospira sp.]|nr:ABC transporter ATP-binding protein [Lachnospira sp.]